MTTPTALLDGIDKTLSDFKTRAYEAKKAYDQSELGRAHRELTAARPVLGAIRPLLRLDLPDADRAGDLAALPLRDAGCSAGYRALWARCVYRQGCLWAIRNSARRAAAS